MVVHALCHKHRSTWDDRNAWIHVTTRMQTDTYTSARTHAYHNTRHRMHSESFRAYIITSPVRHTLCRADGLKVILGKLYMLSGKWIAQCVKFISSVFTTFSWRRAIIKTAWPPKKYCSGLEWWYLLTRLAPSNENIYGSYSYIQLSSTKR